MQDARQKCCVDCRMLCTCGSLSSVICDLILLAAPEFPTFLQGEAAFLLLLASDEAIDPSAGQQAMLTDLSGTGVCLKTENSKGKKKIRLR